MFGICPHCDASTVKTVDNDNRLTIIGCVECDYQITITFPIPIKELEAIWASE